MSWIQVFEYARKNGAFAKEDIEMSVRWTTCAVNDKLCSMGYNNLSYTCLSLGGIIEEYDSDLQDIGYAFTCAVYDAQGIDGINKAQEIYDKIQKMNLNQALIDRLRLTVTPTA